MQPSLETLKRLSDQAQRALQTHWARWTGAEPKGETPSTYWSLRDTLGCAAEPPPAPHDAAQDLFSPAPLAAKGDLFTGREAALAILSGALEEWRSGHKCMVAVEGPQGSGMSSLLAQLDGLIQADDHLVKGRFEAHLRDATDVIQWLSRVLELEDIPASLDELIQRLLALPPRIIVLDDAHFLAFRVMGTGAAVRSIGSLMVATQMRHLWILGFQYYAWRRLIYLYQADRYFTHSVELGFFTEEELRDVITRRFRRHAINLEWNDQDWHRLHQYSRGKPDLAFLYARLLHERHQRDEETDADAPDPLRPIDLSIMKTLEMDDLFTLAELAVHGRLSCEEHRLIFRETIEGSRMRLEHLCNRGLVQRDAFEERAASYRIMPLLSGLITDHLYKVNYLY